MGRFEKISIWKFVVLALLLVLSGCPDPSDGGYPRSVSRSDLGNDSDLGNETGDDVGADTNLAVDLGSPEELPCTPDCNARECGFDGCYGSCGTCESDELCSTEGLCSPIHSDPLCGDGICSGDESSANCIEDCGTVCGDGVCNGNESSQSCANDCGSVCGDGVCNGTESSTNCVGDCGALCGDGVCNGNESSNSCGSDCGSVGTPNPANEVVGYIDSVTPSGDEYVINGWACHPGWNGSIDVHVYVGPLGAGTILKGATTNQPNEAAVYAACANTAGNHRYNIPLTAAEVEQHQGKPIAIYGISPVGNNNNLLTNSGDHYVPGGNGPPGQAVCGDQTCAPGIEDCGSCPGDCPCASGTSCVQNQCVGNNNNPPPGAPDLNSVIWLHTNVSGWPVTSNLSSVSINGGHICLEYDKKNVWPIATIGAENTEIVANPWIFIPHNGQWYGATWEWMRPGQTCKAKTSVAGDHIKQPPFDAASGWTPTSGQTYYFMVSAPARMGQMTVAERTNLVPLVWP
ncbi:MAG: hypothetical protein CMH54_03135 [Myxococcales bacterium]|nr:hypothetical protein [Myxococcales bacterium]